MGYPILEAPVWRGQQAGERPPGSFVSIATSELLNKLA